MGKDEQLSRHASGGMLCAYLADHDAPCPICGYNLRGVTLGVCPECECPIELGVSSSSSFLGAWLLALLAFAMPLSFDLLVGLMMIISTVMTGFEDASAIFLMISLLTLSMTCIGMLWVLVARKRDWLRMPRRKQWRLAWMMFAGVFLVHLLVGVGTALIAQ